MQKIIAFAFIIVAAAALCAADPTIGVSMGDLRSQRWKNEADSLTRLAREAGAKVILKDAGSDAGLQNLQVQELIDLGADVIIIVAEDKWSAAEAVDAAAKAGIPVIAYDRVIPNPKLSACVTCDFIEIGRLQAQGILAVKNSGDFVLLGGSPSDPAAFRCRAGQMEVLQPYIDDGRIRIVADQWVDNWDPAEAQMIMEDIIQTPKNKVDAVVASNDGTALGAIKALKRHGLAGKVSVSGQDATPEGCNSVARGEMTVTVLKDLRPFSTMAIECAMRLARGEPLIGIENQLISLYYPEDPSQESLPFLFTPLKSVTRATIYDDIVKTGLVDYDVVYKGVPANKRPQRP